MNVQLNLQPCKCTVYAPTFFKIKYDWKITDGAKNFFYALKMARETLTKEESVVARKYFKINSFFAHPEAILLAALFSDDLSVRKWAVECILKDRERRENRGLRQFKVPGESLNLGATSYLNLVNFETVSPDYITEPPITFDFSNEDLINCAKGKDLPIPNIPCHSQNVERAVQRTSEAASKVIGHKKRHGHILQMIESREKITKNATKSCFFAAE